MINNNNIDNDNNNILQQTNKHHNTKQSYKHNIINNTICNIHNINNYY